MRFVGSATKMRAMKSLHSGESAMLGGNSYITFTIFCIIFRDSALGTAGSCKIRMQGRQFLIPSGKH